MKILTAIFLLFITASQTFADVNDSTTNQQEYDIEVIIFEDAHARYINNESWNQTIHSDTQITDTSENQNESAAISTNINTSNTNESSKRYKNLKPGILINEYKRINASSEYKVLRYSAWRQAGLPEENAFDINIEELENAHTTKSENAIVGTLKVVLARYLHFHGQLEYLRNEPVPIQNNTVITAQDVVNNQSGEPALNSEQPQFAINKFPIEIQRRMRSKELHYIDHPLVGILVQINPVDKTEKAKDQ